MPNGLALKMNSGTLQLQTTKQPVRGGIAWGVLVLIAVTLAPSGASAQTTTTAPSTETAASTDGQAAMLQAAWASEKHAEETGSIDDFRAAAAALERCVGAQSQQLEVERTLGYLCLDKLSDPKKAYSHLNTAYGIDSSDVDWGLTLARAAAANGMVDRQLEVLRELVLHHPNDAEAHLELAKALAHAGQTKEAEKEYEAADQNANDQDWIHLAYAHHLHDEGRDADAVRVANAVLVHDPQSTEALGLLGDIHRGNWDLTEARSEYARAMQFDPTFTTANEGLTNIDKARSPQLQSDYFLFVGTDHYHQMGLFETLTVPVSDHVAIDANYNTGYFRNDDTAFSSVVRYQEGLGVEDRFNHELTFRGGITAFQQPTRQVVGFNAEATWIPNEHFWFDGTYRLNDPVNDTMFTVGKALSQDVTALGGGYQFNDRLGIKAVASWAEYSDSNSRIFLHVEPSYLLYEPAQLRVGAAYESIQYGKNTAYSSRASYQTMGPVLHAEPSIWPWLSIHMNVEPLYIVAPPRVGVELTIGPAFHFSDRLEGGIEYSYYYLPGSSVNYSGNGLRATLTYRF